VIGQSIAHYDVLAKPGEGGPAVARTVLLGELWRGRAEAKEASQW